MSGETAREDILFYESVDQIKKKMNKDELTSKVLSRTYHNIANLKKKVKVDKKEKSEFGIAQW